MSGIAISKEVLQTFEDFKLGHKHAWVIFKMNDTLTEVVVDAKGDKDATYEDMLSHMPEKEPRYIVIEVPYVEDGCNRSKLVFVNWAPDVAKIRQKMVYASTKGDIRRRLTGIGLEVQATDMSEIALETVLDKIGRV